MKNIFPGILVIISSIGIFAQNTKPADLPLNVLVSGNDNTKSLILYITGDGGWNNFSKGFAKEFAAKGFPVVSLNANKYFWKKKTPAQAASDLTGVINLYLKQFNRSRVSIIGYSFGADVLPFIYNKFPGDIQSRIKSISLLSPSSATDFEIHLMGMMGAGGGGNSVPEEINRMANVPVSIVTGDDEKDFPFEKISTKKYAKKTLTGGHHYDGNVKKVVETVLETTP